MHPFEKKWKLKDFLHFVVPSILSMVLISFYTTIDGFFMGKFVNHFALASINIVLPIISLSYGLAILISVGSCSVIGIYLGENKKQLANRYFSFILILLLTISLIITLLGILFIDNIITHLGATYELFPYVKTYALITIISTPFMMFKLFFEYFSRLDGTPKLAFFMSLSGFILNILLDYIFVVLLNLGIIGAGLGTGISIFSSNIIGLIYFFGNTSNLKPKTPKFSLYFIKKMLINGSGDMFSEFSVGFVTFLFNTKVLLFAGEKGVAALSIIFYLFYFFVAIFMGISSGLQPSISYNYGSKNRLKLKELTKYGFLSISIFSLIIFLTLELFGNIFISIFVLKNSQVYLIALNGIKLFSICFLINGYNIFITTFLSAISKGRISLIISINRGLIFVVLCLVILPYFFNLNGVWLSMPVAEILGLLLALPLFIKNKSNG